VTVKVTKQNKTIQEKGAEMTGNLRKGVKQNNRKTVFVASLTHNYRMYGLHNQF
jgi:hypothetical protein